MTPQTLFWLFILLIVLDFLWDTYTDYLNARRFDAPLPDEVRDIYDEADYRRSIAYKKMHYRLGLVKSVFSTLFILVLLFTRAFAWLDRVTGQWTDNPVMHSLLFFAVLLTLSVIFSLPFDYYAVFKIEEKFGFNRSTLKLFVTDKIKSWLLSLVFLFLVGYPVIWIYYHYPQDFWWMAWLVIAFFSLIMNLLYSDLIVPLFNKQTPLPPGELRRKLEDLARRAGFKIKDVYLIDGSKRSTKANAYFSGFGPRKRIVLYDTLQEDLTPEEITAVMAHEIGHYKKKHILWQWTVSMALTGLTLWLLSLALQSETLAQALGVSRPSFHIGLIAFGLLYGIVEHITGILGNMLSRRFEFQADRYAMRLGYGDYLATALKKLARKSYANLTPHPLYVKIHYSHPPLAQRLKHLYHEK